MMVNMSWDSPRRILQNLTKRGPRVEFLKKGLAFRGDDCLINMLLLFVMEALAEFERSHRRLHPLPAVWPPFLFSRCSKTRADNGDCSPSSQRMVRGK